MRGNDQDPAVTGDTKAQPSETKDADAEGLDNIVFRELRCLISNTMGAVKNWVENKCVTVPPSPAADNGQRSPRERDNAAPTRLGDRSGSRHVCDPPGTCKTSSIGES